MNEIFYKKGYKYQLVQPVSFSTQIKPEQAIISSGGFIVLGITGTLQLKSGYAWDGPSGPTIDSTNFMRGSLVHDALYQLIREGFISSAKFREKADKLLRKTCREDGMSALRAWWVYRAVRTCGFASASPKNAKQILRAPSGK